MDAAIEFLIAEQGMESLTENDSETAFAADTTNPKEASESTMESTEQPREKLNERIHEEESASVSNIKTVHAKCSSQTDDQVHWLA